MSTMPERYRPFMIYSFPALGYAALIFGISSVRGYSIPNLPFFSFDKIIHALEFGLFGILLYRSFYFHLKLKRPYVITLLAGGIYALLDEIHQYFVPGRYCSINDLGADLIGIIIFAGVSKWLNTPAVR